MPVIKSIDLLAITWDTVTQLVIGGNDDLVVYIVYIQ